MAGLASALDVSACGELGENNTLYELTQNITFAGECFKVTGYNNTIDGNGFAINYSNNGTIGVGINITTGRNNTLIKDLIIWEGVTTNNGKNAIVSSIVSNLTIVNVSIRMIGISTGIQISGNTAFPNSIWNSTIVHTGDGRAIQFGTNSRWGTAQNVMINSSSTGTSAIGIDNVGSQDPNFNNVTIVSNKFGIQFAGGSGYRNATLNNSNITAMGTSSVNILIGGTHLNLTIQDTILRSSKNNINISGSTRLSNINLTNVSSFNGTDLVINILAPSNTSIFNRWWFIANVSSSGSPLQDVNVTSTNNSNILHTTQLTGVNGQTIRLPYVEYWFGNSTNITYFNNYTINATKTGYENYSNSTINLTILNNLFLNIVLTSEGGASQCDYTSGDLEITDGSVCNITTSVNVFPNQCRIYSGKIRIYSGGLLICNGTFINEGQGLYVNLTGAKWLTRLV